MDAISWQLLIEGAWTTLWISAIAITFGVAIGLLIALVRMLRIPVIDQLLVVYISLARATPLVTLVLFLFLSLPTVGINLDKNAAAIVALTLNTSAFNAEIWRNAFRTFPREQREAAESVGLSGDEARAILAGDDYADLVREQEQFYLSAGINSVPAVVINDKHLISGGQPPEVFEQALRQIAAG